MLKFQWKICKTEFLKFDQNFKNFELFLKNSNYQGIYPRILWLDVISIEKSWKNETSFIKDHLDRNSPYDKK